MVKDIRWKARDKTGAVNNLRENECIHTALLQMQAWGAKVGANRLMNELETAVLFLRVTQSRLRSMFVLTVKEKDVTAEVSGETKR